MSHKFEKNTCTLTLIAAQLCADWRTGRAALLHVSHTASIVYARSMRTAGFSIHCRNMEFDIEAHLAVVGSVATQVALACLRRKRRS